MKERFHLVWNDKVIYKIDCPKHFTNKQIKTAAREKAAKILLPDAVRFDLQLRESTVKQLRLRARVDPSNAKVGYPVGESRL